MRLGTSVASAGDVNGDGISDIVLGTPNYIINNQFYGAAFVFHGSTTGIDNNTAAGTSSGQASALMGFSVTSAGDLNGDGFGDIAVGAPNYDNGEENEGVVRIYYGSDQGIDFESFTLLESNKPNANMGISVSSAGDTNGDGFDDLTVGANNYSNGQTGEGAIFIYRGSAGGISTSPSAILEIDQANAQLGSSVSGAGDLNADGFSDVIVGAPNTGGGAGSVYVYYGKPGIITSSSGKLLIENIPGINFAGRKVTGIGDINGDGFGDVAVNLDFDGGQSGTISIFTGSKSGLSSSPVLNLQTGGLPCQSMSGAGDINGDGYGDFIAGIPGYSTKGGLFVYYGSATGLSQEASLKVSGDTPNAGFGNAVSSAGDVNGDGYSDVISGTPSYQNGQAAEGAVYVYHGSQNGLITQNPTPTEIDVPFSQYGSSVSGAGDVNGDGYSDIIGGAPYYNNQFQSEGAVIIHYGNEKRSQKNMLRLYSQDLNSDIKQSSITEMNFGIGLSGQSFLGKNEGKLVWETRKEGQGFSHNSPITNSTQFTGQQPGYSDLATNLQAAVSKTGMLTRVRARIKYAPSLAITGQIYSPWRYHSAAGSLYQTTNLPVTLVSFTAEKSEKHVTLEWITSNEEDSESFEIQRSSDGKTWQAIGKRAAKGNSTLEEHYTFTDSTARPGQNFYRLKMIDLDQTYTFSRVRSVNMAGITENMINLFPNPTTDKLKLQADQLKVTSLKIISTAGNVVVEIINPDLEVDIRQLKSGVYVVVMKLEDGTSVSKSIVKK